MLEVFDPIANLNFYFEYEIFTCVICAAPQWTVRCFDVFREWMNEKLNFVIQKCRDNTSTAHNQLHLVSSIRFDSHFSQRIFCFSLFFFKKQSIQNSPHYIRTCGSRDCVIHQNKISQVIKILKIQIFFQMNFGNCRALTVRLGRICGTSHIFIN